MSSLSPRPPMFPEGKPSVYVNHYKFKDSIGKPMGSISSHSFHVAFNVVILTTTEHKKVSQT